MLTAIARAAFGATLLALGLELAFRLLPVSSASAVGYYTDNQVLTYPAGLDIRVSSGWDLRNPQRLHANNAGFAADRDFEPNHAAVALIGDSHVEAAELDARDRPAARLQDLLGPARPVFAFGSPGTSLLDYAERVRMAHERYQVRDMVILLDVGDVRQSLCGSGQIAAPCLDPATGRPGEERQPEASMLKRWVRQSALAQYLFSQLKVSPDRLLPTLRALPATLLPGGLTTAPAADRPAPVPAAVGPTPERLDQIAQAFFERVRPHVSGRFVILIDRPLPGRDASRLPVADSDRFAAQARSQGFTVVDMADAYAAHTARSTLSLAVGPYDWHHNALGASLLAQAAAHGLATARPWQGAPAR